MPTPPPKFNDEFARALAAGKSTLIGHRSVRQLGATSIAARDAPPWPQLDGPRGEAIIETFLVDDTWSLTPLGEGYCWLDAWRERAEYLADRLASTFVEHSLELTGPGYLTCSITPVELLEGLPHLDDDQFLASEGIGVVAIVGQHCPPRVAIGSAPLAAVARTGPIELSEAFTEEFRSDEGGCYQAAVDDITVLGGFGQLHAGPKRGEVEHHDVRHRQLMVFRAPT